MSTNHGKVHTRIIEEMRHVFLPRLADVRLLTCLWVAGLTEPSKLSLSLTAQWLHAQPALIHSQLAKACADATSSFSCLSFIPPCFSVSDDALLPFFAQLIEDARTSLRVSLEAALEACPVCASPVLVRCDGSLRETCANQHVIGEIA